MRYNKTDKSKTINEKTLIVTLDIGKKVHYSYFRTQKNKDVKPFSVYNNRQGFEELWTKLCRFKIEHGLEDVIIGFESTGPYAEPICHFFRKKPVQVIQVNPMHTKRIKELTGNSPNKTDQKDPRVIADVIMLGHFLTVVVPEGPAAQLRRLTHARERAISHRTAINNQLQHLVFLVFPELLNIVKPSTKTGMYLIKNYSDPKRIVSTGIESIRGLLRKISRGKFNQDRAEMLFKAAQESVGITEGKESILLEISHLVSSIENQNRFIDRLEDQITEYLRQIPYSESLMSIKGIGRITVAGLIGEVGDFKKFKTISEIMKLAGLNLFEVSSGTHEGRHHISKRGRSLMRKLLFFAAINVVKSNGIMHEKYQRMLDNGTIKMKALVAISRKLLRIIFALARDSSEYDHEYNRNHNYKLAA